MPKIRISPHTTCTLLKENLSIEVPDISTYKTENDLCSENQVKAFQYLKLKGEKSI